MPQTPIFLTVKEVAATLRFKSLQPVHGLIRSGQLRASYVGRTWLVAQEDFDQFLATAREL